MDSRDSTTLLNINDDEANRYALTRILRSAGYRVLEGATGAEALRLTQEERPDLVVLDVKLPDLNGIEVCRRLKADPRTARIAVLHVSARYVRTENKVEGLESGADGYLAQPVDAEELLATVRALLRMRRAEEQARRVALEWKSTFEALGDGVCLLDGEGRVVRTNRSLSLLLCKPEAELLGQPFAQLMREAAGTETLLPLCCGGGASCREQAEVNLRGRWYRVAADPVEDAAGGITGAVRIVSDITSHREMEDALRQRAEELAEADRRKDEFLAMLAHELRNPLAAIVTAVGLLERRHPGDEREQRMRTIIRRQSQHLTRLVDDLLDVSRITRGKVVLRREPIDLRPVLEHALSLMKPRAEQRGLKLESQLEDGPLRVEADATRLEQVFTNLLDNATKYTDSGGTVCLKVERTVSEERPWVVVRVKDTGVGIRPELLPTVFELFLQAEAAEHSRGGLGIGLTLVRSLVQMHEGRVEAHSAGLGQGSEFVVWLPLLREQAFASPTSHPTIGQRRTHLPLLGHCQARPA